MSRQSGKKSQTKSETAMMYQQATTMSEGDIKEIEAIKRCGRIFRKNLSQMMVVELATGQESWEFELCLS